MVTKVHTYKSKKDGSYKQRYQVGTKQGYLKNLQERSILLYQPKLTGEMMNINVTTPDYKVDLSIPQASHLYNMLGGAKKPCNCTTDCGTNRNCKCKGVLCTTKCHIGRGGNLFCQWINY